MSAGGSHTCGVRTTAPSPAGASTRNGQDGARRHLYRRSPPPDDSPAASSTTAPSPAGATTPRPGLPARRQLHRRSAPAAPCLRRENRRDRRLLGRQRAGQATPARGHLHRRRAPAAPTPAASGPTGPSPAGAATPRARPRPPAGTFTARQRRRRTPAGSGRTAPSPAGATTQRPGHPARGHLHDRERGRLHTCGMRANGTVACWGDNAFGQATPPAGTFIAVERRRLPHVRDQDERQRRLLGRQRHRPGHAARRHLHRGERRRLPHLRDEDERHPGLLGRHTTAGHPAGRPRLSSRRDRSAPASDTPRRRTTTVRLRGSRMRPRPAWGCHRDGTGPSRSRSCRLLDSRWDLSRNTRQPACRSQRGGVGKEQLVHAGEVIPLPALVLGQGVVDAVGGI